MTRPHKTLIDTRSVVMNCRVSKASTGRSRVAQQKLLTAVASTGAELSPSHRERSQRRRDLAGDTTPVQARKRRLDATTKSDPVPAKRARLTQTDTQQPGVEGKRTEPVNKTTLQQPKPKPPKHRDTSLPARKVEGQEQASPATRLRKRQIDSDGDDNEPELKRARLTRRNLTLFNNMGRRKASNNASASTPPESTAGSSTSKTTSTTTSGFAIQADKNGILQPLHSKPPENVENIRKRHARSRATASPPESEYRRYANNVGKAPNEATMVVEVSEHMLKRYDDEGYNRAFNQAFTGFPKDVGFNNGLSAPQPDFVEGLERREYRPFPVDEHVNGAVLYKDDPYSLTLPHLAGEWKGRGKDMEEARLQSAYDGAALVYARNQALSYLGKPDPPGHAEITTFTTDGTNLNFYAHYATPSGDNGTLEYHQYQYASSNVKDTHQGHKDGRKGIRNEQDRAREQSCALRDQLKEHWKQRRGDLPRIAEGAPLPDLDDYLGKPLPTQETNSDPHDDDEVEQPPPPAKSSTYKRTGGKAPPVRTDDESGYEIIDRPSYAPTPPRSFEERRRSARLSKPRQLYSEDVANITAKKHKSSATRN